MSPKRRRISARQRDVEARIAAFRPGPFPREASPSPAVAETSDVAALLRDLGPLFTAFGRHLSTRIDLLDSGARAALSALPSARPPAAPESVVAILEEALAVPLDEAFAAFELLPTVSVFDHQRHRARLFDGRAVVVYVAAPSLAGEVTADGPALASIAPMLVGEVDPAAITEAADAFVRQVRDQFRLDSASRFLAAIGTLPRVSGPPSLGVPTVVASHSAGPVLTVEAWSGTGLEDWRDAPGTDDRVRADGASTLSQAWLTSALFGPAMPLAFRADDILWTGEGRPVSTASSYLAVDDGARSRLWRYLQAVATAEPDLAAEAVRGLLDPPPGQGPEADVILRQHLRQAEPLRESDFGASDDLVGMVALQARIVRRLGYRPQRSLIAFWQSMASLDAVVRSLSGDDSLRRAVEAQRLRESLNGLAEAMDPAALKLMLGEAATRMISMPQKLDSFLTLAAQGKASIKLEMAEPAETRARRDRSATLIAALLALAAVVLFAHHVASSVPGPWVERAATVIVTLLGVALLRGLTR